VLRFTIEVDSLKPRKIRLVMARGKDRLRWAFPATIYGLDAVLAFVRGFLRATLTGEELRR
jgi:hypothetical protein